MKKILLTMALFAAIGAVSAQSNRNDNCQRYDEREVFQDHNGSYHWQVSEQRVWIPTQRVGGSIFGRTIPGHYETRTDRQKIYHYDNNRYGRSKHPHGMPPGQRKKYAMNQRWDDSRRDNDRDRRWSRDND